MKVFISYSHQQGPWVWDRLVPVLRAAGVEVLIDKQRFVAGLALFPQMDALQDQADVSLLVLSPDYDASTACVHERTRAIAADPSFTLGKVLPVVRIAGADMSLFTSPSQTPLWVDLKDDRAADKWALLLATLETTALGACPVHWLDVRDELIAKVRNQSQSVNLIVKHSPNWRALFEHLRREHMPGMGVVNLDSGTTTTRQGLVQTLLAACGQNLAVPPKHDLALLTTILENRSKPALIAFQHFERVEARSKVYGEDLFHALRHLLEQRKLVLLIESRVPYRDLLPAAHLLSRIQVHNVELQGHIQP